MGEPDVPRLGGRHRDMHGALDLVDVGDELLGGDIAAQQRLVADQHAVDVAVGAHDGGEPLQLGRVAGPVAVEPSAQRNPQRQVGGEFGDVAQHAGDGVGAHPSAQCRHLDQVGVDLLAARIEVASRGFGRAGKARTPDRRSRRCSRAPGWRVRPWSKHRGRPERTAGGRAGWSGERPCAGVAAGRPGAARLTSSLGFSSSSVRGDGAHAPGDESSPVRRGPGLNMAEGWLCLELRRHSGREMLHTDRCCFVCPNERLRVLTCEVAARSPAIHLSCICWVMP